MKTQIKELFFSIFSKKKRQELNFKRFLYDYKKLIGKEPILEELLYLELKSSTVTRVSTGQPRYELHSINKDKIIEKLEEYIEILGKEIYDISSIAIVHGWKSKRIEIGKKLREEIKLLKEE